MAMMNINKILKDYDGICICLAKKFSPIIPQEDARQIVKIAIFENLNKYDGSIPLPNYLWRIGFYALSHEVMNYKPVRTTKDLQFVDYEDANLVSKGFDIKNQMLNRAQLNLAFQYLTDDERRLIIDSLTFTLTEIAKKQNRPVGQISMKYKRAIEKVREVFDAAPTKKTHWRKKEISYSPSVLFQEIK
jgi:DNA-directed RNA polymerase specialized sigma24 family protein